jgi:hypothetical protein
MSGVQLERMAIPSSMAGVTNVGAGCIATLGAVVLAEDSVHLIAESSGPPELRP